MEINRNSLAVIFMSFGLSEFRHTACRVSGSITSLVLELLRGLRFEAESAGRRSRMDQLSAVAHLFKIKVEYIFCRCERRLLVVEDPQLFLLEKRPHLRLMIEVAAEMLVFNLKTSVQMVLKWLTSQPVNPFVR